MQRTQMKTWLVRVEAGLYSHQIVHCTTNGLFGIWITLTFKRKSIRTFYYISNTIYVHLNEYERLKTELGLEGFFVLEGNETYTTR